MSLPLEREKVLQEVHLIPEEMLAEVYSSLHYFRLGLESSPDKSKTLMQYAGCWRDMPTEVFAAFAQNVVRRRQRAFSGRRGHETGTD